MCNLDSYDLDDRSHEITSQGTGCVMPDKYGIDKEEPGSLKRRFEM